MEANAVRVQEEAAHAGFRCAIETIAGNGVANAGEVNADLMGAAGANTDFEKRKLCQPPQDTIFGVSRAALVEAGGHAGAADRVAGNLRVDGTGFTGETSMDQGDVGFLHRSPGELRGQISMGGVGARDQKNAAGIAVQAMDDAGAFVTAYLRERLEVMQQCVDEGSGVIARAGVDDESGGFIYGDQIDVRVQNLNRDIFGECLERFEAGGFHGNALSAPERD